MSLEIEDMLQALNSAGWSVDSKLQPQIPVLGKKFLSRYPKLPPGYLNFLSRVTYCCNSEETTWFLCEDDYNDVSNSAFVWNEFERQSLEAADADEDWKNEITSFWNTHLPILISVKSNYAYLALRFTKTGGEPEVVYGCEPEYEETSLVCNSFYELAVLITRVVGGESHRILSRIL